MIIDIHYKVQYFDRRKDERVCFMCAVRTASVLNVDEGRVKLKSGQKPIVCDHCNSFIHDTINTGEEPKKGVPPIENALNNGGRG